MAQPSRSLAFAPAACLAAPLAFAQGFKPGRPCLVPGATAGNEVRERFDAGCNDPAVLGRLETNPPAALYAAPESRRKSVLRDPDALKKLSI